MNDDVPSLDAQDERPEEVLRVNARRRQLLMDSIRRAQAEFLIESDPAATFDLLLTDLLALTHSAYGFIGEVLVDSQGMPYLKTFAISNIAWDEHTRTVYEAHKLKGLEFHDLSTLFGVVLTTERVVMSNRPGEDPRRGGLPEGDPPLNAFLGIPLHYGTRIVGMVGLTNRPAGYDDELVDELQPFLSSCASLIEAIRLDRARKEIEEERDRFFTISLDLMCIITMDGRFVRVNPAWTLKLGWTVEELLIQPLEHFVHPDDLQKTHDEHRSLVGGNHCMIGFENRYRCKDGTYRWLSWSGLFDPERKSIYATAQDVTERKRTEQHLLEREARIRSIVETAVDGIVVITDKGIVEAFNPAAVRLFGFHADEILGRNVNLLMGSPDREFHDAYLREYLRTGRAHVIGIGREVMVRRKDGSFFPAELTVSEMRVGTERKFTGILRDITERKRVERELADLSTRLQAVLDAAAEVSIIATDTAGVITVFNVGAERLLGYRADEMIGMQTPVTFHDPEEVRSRGEEMSRVCGRELSGFDVFVEPARRGASDSREWTYIRKDGSRLTVNLFVTALKAPDGQMTGFLGIGSDVTARKQAEVELQRAKELAEKANRSKSDFLANMSHELRTPMTAVLGYTDILLMEPHADAAQRLQALHAIKRNGQHLLQLINDILDLSKIEAGKTELELTDCQPWQIVLEVVSALRVQAQTKGITLQARPEGRIPRAITADPLRVRQILMNLVSNAIKFTNQGTVSVRCRVERSPSGSFMVCFDVEDEGIGMTAEQIRGLFQAFYQGDASTTRKYGGTGLGLHISKRYAKSMGGDIVVQSTHGKGSHFTFVLPISDLAAANLVDAHTVVPERIRAEVVPSADPASRHVGRVLIAEDSRDTQRILAFMLARAGFQFETVDTGQSAVDRALAGQFDVVLMDMQMPEMDGYAATRYLRDRGYAQPIIALTAHAMRADEEKCLAAGCTDYVTKPIDPETLVERVTRHLLAASEPLHGGRPDRATP